MTRWKKFDFSLDALRSFKSSPTDLYCSKFRIFGVVITTGCLAFHRSFKVVWLALQRCVAFENSSALHYFPAAGPQDGCRLQGRLSFAKLFSIYITLHTTSTHSSAPKSLLQHFCAPRFAAKPDHGAVLYYSILVFKKYFSSSACKI